MRSSGLPLCQAFEALVPDQGRHLKAPDHELHESPIITSRHQWSDFTAQLGKNYCELVVSEKIFRQKDRFLVLIIKGDRKFENKLSTFSTQNPWSL